MAKKITLREIAALTGTSVSTVSKALNQSPEISENTRRRIIEGARVSHYRAGQQLDIYRDGHQQMIGFLVPFKSVFCATVAGRGGYCQNS